MHKGQLIKWKDEKRFGFIQPENQSQEVFLHVSELKDLTRRPQVGDTFYYHLIVKKGKIRAGNAFILGARSKPSSSSKSLSKKVNKYLFPYWEALVLSILPLAGSLHFAWITGNPIPIILYTVMSLVTFFLYVEDKSRAKR